MNSTKLSTEWGIARRWTKELVKDGFTPVVDIFLDHYSELGVTTTEAMFIIHLMKYKWNERHPYPSFGVIAAKMGISDTAVRNHARSLEKKGILYRHQRLGETNEFDLTPLFFKLEQIKKRDSETSMDTEVGRSTSESLWNTISANVREKIEAEVVANLSPLLRRQWDKGGARHYVYAECLKRLEEVDMRELLQIRSKS